MTDEVKAALNRAVLELGYADLALSLDTGESEKNRRRVAQAYKLIINAIKSNR